MRSETDFTSPQMDRCLHMVHVDSIFRYSQVEFEIHDNVSLYFTKPKATCRTIVLCRRNPNATLECTLYAV